MRRAAVSGFLDQAALPPLWPFGFGLSYTSFSLRLVQTPQPATIAPSASSDWIVEATNSGTRDGDVVVVCYVSATSQSAVTDPPVRQLFDFTRVEALPAGASRILPFSLTPRGRALATAAGEWLTPPGTYEVECEAGGVSTTGKSAFVVA